MTHQEYEAAVTARAHELMAASHAIMRENNARLPKEQRKPLPGWSTYVDAATAEINAVLDAPEEETDTPAAAPDPEHHEPAADPALAAEAATPEHED